MLATRVWIFRGLVLAATALLLYSWFQPLWGLDIALLRPDAVLVHPWGEEVNTGAWTQQFKLPTMPAFFAPLMWAYLILFVLLLLYSMFAGERKVGIGGIRLSLPQAIIGGLAILHLIFAVMVPIMISLKLSQFQLGGVYTPLQGKVTYDMGSPYVSEATSSLRLGYWLAWVVGGSLLVLALLRNLIIGKGTTGTAATPADAA
jgi:hypothetical protein